MEQVSAAISLQRQGYYRSALSTLSGDERGSDSAEVSLVKAELLEMIGDHSQARAIAERLRKSTRLAPAHRARCESVLGRILLEDGETDTGVSHLQRAVSLSGKARDFKHLCWALTKLVLVISERSGPDAAIPLLAELRTTATKLGDPHVTAHLHATVAEIEALRGSLESALQHLRISQQLIAGGSNVWIAATVENTLLAVCILKSQLDRGRHHSERALDLSDRSGAASCRRSAAANTGTLFLMSGEFDQAFSYFEKALSILPSRGNRNNGIIEALAQTRLAQRRFNECEQLLERIDSAIQNERDRTFYSHRCADLTRVRLFIAQRRFSDALQFAERTIQSCRVTDDQISLKLALLAKAEILEATGRVDSCIDTLEDATSVNKGFSPEAFALHELVLGRALAAFGQAAGATAYASRAKRICESTKNIPALMHVASGLSDDELDRRSDNFSTEFRCGGRNALHAMTAVMLNSANPELVATELANMLIDCGCASDATVECVDESGERRVLLTTKVQEGREQVSPGTMGRLKHFVIGTVDGRRIEIAVSPAQDIDAEATVGLAGMMIERLSEFENSRRERENRTKLWLPEDGPDEQFGAVISGHMRDVMRLAQRVARTTVNVLIIGESGTGKEILARAVHAFSDRAQKAFVPLNCAAVPRDLLESQLFGHRRGAFTGAERDQPGLIRSAEGGTLFLDEIGEMSPELQPKLLRFLESGEIAPLGESSPFRVNVRVIAATNSNLENAVRDGKFREDLYYRLNVVPLTIKPLRERRDEIPGLVNQFVANAAREYAKSDVKVAEETMERLLLYRWPGNVRQLQNEIRRMVALAEPNSTLEPASISADILGAMPNLRQPVPSGYEVAVPLHDKLLPTLSRIECEMIKAALRAHHGRLEPAAKALGISRKGLYLKRQRLGL